MPPGVAAVGGHGVVDVEDGEDAAKVGDFVAARAKGVPRAVAALVVLEDAEEDLAVRAERRGFEHLVAVLRVAADLLELLVREAALFLEDVVGDADLAAVDEKPREDEVVALGFRQLEHAPEEAREDGDVDAVVHEVAAGAVHVVDLRNGPDAARHLLTRERLDDLVHETEVHLSRIPEPHEQRQCLLVHELVLPDVHVVEQVLMRRRDGVGDLFLVVDVDGENGPVEQVKDDFVREDSTCIQQGQPRRVHDVAPDDHAGLQVLYRIGF